MDVTCSVTDSNTINEPNNDGSRKRKSVNDQQNENKNVHETVKQAVQFLLDRVPFKPKIGIICGSGLGCMADSLENVIRFPYEDIPNFPVCTVKGHTGQLAFGHVNSVPVVCMLGRFHYFEGYPLWKCTMPVRVMKMIGVTHLVVSNAAGGLNKQYKIGDIMIIKDHVNMLGFGGRNPLVGLSEGWFGPNFPKMKAAYSRELIKVAKKIAVKEGFDDILHDGVYACVGGPNFETVAEIKLLCMLGCDAVGMSTIPEVTTAKHCGMTVFGFSLITNICQCDYDYVEEVNHEKVLNVGKGNEKVLQRFVSQVVTQISDNFLCGK